MFFPCCCTTCFKPCDCFARNCELHITSEGWVDNGSTDCAGIADRVFNKTYAITSMNVTSGPSYGFTCDFIAGEDDLVLTKLVGGDCICKEQTAFYTIEGTLLCERGEDGTYSLRLVLYYKVPVYDDNITCPTPPCPYEALWETWIWDYTLATGATSSSAICDLGTSPIGPLPFSTDASAQTTCGLGLDGTDATVMVEWKFCDPITGSTGECGCCNEIDESSFPDKIQADISGIASFVVSQCDTCADLNGTFVLERVNGECSWVYDFETNPCTGNPTSIDRFSLILFFAQVGHTPPFFDNTIQCNMILYFDSSTSGIVFGNAFHPAAFEDLGNWSSGGNKCSDLNGYAGLQPVNGLYVDCDISSATATITALP